uniref:Mitochondrial inner membrane protein OXA1 n=1 Tax=Panagrellus redivivus TaxID=6233 RepID=A0A7E4W3K0_PANRE
MLSVPARSVARLGLRGVARNSRSSTLRLTLPSATVCGPNQIRFLSTEQIFGTNVAGFEIPAAPLPPPPMPSIEELAASGESVLDELGLLSWWKPSSYLRLALEAVHVHLDLPWWGAIVATTVALRLACIYVPIMSQRLVAKQSAFKPELEEFKNRMNDARAEGNNLLMQQVLLEQRDFMKSKDIKLGRQFIVMIANGGVFMTQFFAIRRMAQANYPGFADGGALWFTDLTACDPYYLLPVISAVTLAAVMKVGVETGTSSEQMSPLMRLGMTYGLPLVVLASSSQFASALCVYWTTSNVISLIYAGMFKVPAVRALFKIPPVMHHPVKPSAAKASAWKQAISQYKSTRGAAPSLSSLREKDAELFKKAGRAKPVAK